MGKPILFVNACVRTESRTRWLAQNYYGIQDVRQISAVGLDIYGADADAIMKAAEDTLEGMNPDG